MPFVHAYLSGRQCSLARNQPTLSIHGIDIIFSNLTIIGNHHSIFFFFFFDSSGFSCFQNIINILAFCMYTVIEL